MMILHVSDTVSFNTLLLWMHSRARLDLVASIAGGVKVFCSWNNVAPTTPFLAQLYMYSING